MPHIYLVPDSFMPSLTYKENMLLKHPIPVNTLLCLLCNLSHFCTCNYVSFLIWTGNKVFYFMLNFFSDCRLSINFCVGLALFYVFIIICLVSWSLFVVFQLMLSSCSLSQYGSPNNPGLLPSTKKSHQTQCPCLLL